MMMMMMMTRVDLTMMMMMMMVMMVMMMQVMEKTLSKLATFDEGSMMGSMLGFVVSIFFIILMVLAKHQFQHLFLGRQIGHIFAKCIYQKIDMSPSRTRKSM